MSHMKLHRRDFLLSASLLSAAPLAAGQANQDFSNVEIKVVPVSGGIYMLQGSGGNIGASVGDDGIVIVDDEFAPLTGKIRAALRGITGKDIPVRFVINTHYHADHTGGNVNFGETSTIIAQENARKRLVTGSLTGNLGSKPMEVKPTPKVGLPIITFEHDVTVHLNGEDIQAIYFPAGHTDGDAMIFYPHANVVHMGDDFVHPSFPFIDIASGGSVQGMIAACENVIPKLPPDVKVIPGHGDLATLDDVRAWLGMLQETTAVVRKALQQGNTLEEMKKENILAPWHKYAFRRMDENFHLDQVYNSLTGKKDGQFVEHH
jgi:glyoxylase-like metal-dependent hydrolase (beta-lactamase superfamily II)